MRAKCVPSASAKTGLCCRGAACVEEEGASAAVWRSHDSTCDDWVRDADCRLFAAQPLSESPLPPSPCPPSLPSTSST